MSLVKDVRCAVLGASGFLGINLCKQLLQAGAHIHAFDRQNLSVPKDLKEQRWFLGDFSDASSLTKVIRKCEIVYHLIDDSIPNTANKDPINFLCSNVLNTVQMLDICRQEGVRKVIFASSGGTVYGITDSHPISEKFPTNPICAYGINKLTIEKYLSLYNHLYGLEYAVARLANPFGPFQSTRKSQGIIGTLISNHLNQQTTEIWGDGEVIRDFIYINDTVDALIKLIAHKGQNQVLNIGSGHGRSINNIITDLEKVIGEPLRIAYKKTDRTVDVPINILDINLARDALKWQPQTNWTNALHMTKNWFSLQNDKSNNRIISTQLDDAFAVAAA